jgi:hypothetical protein
MSSTTLDRRLRKLEAGTGSEDIQDYLHRPLVEWPDHILQLAIDMGEEELTNVTANLESWGHSKRLSACGMPACVGGGHKMVPVKRVPSCRTPPGKCCSPADRAKV